MTLTPMRFKDYIWPHNPLLYTINYQRQMAVHTVPMGHSALQEIGLGHRVMQGRGEFSGAEAYRDFGRLANVFYDPGPGPLIHPIWQSANTYFVSLQVEQEPRPDYVRYRFVFYEEAAPYSGTPALTSSIQLHRQKSSPQQSRPASYRVQKGDSLWAIAQRHQVSLEQLIAHNPHIKNPNLIYPGQEVFLP